MTWLLAHWKLAGAAGAAVAFMVLLTAVLWYRGEAYQARAERDLAIAQGDVLARAVKACSAGVDQAKRVGDAAVAGTAELLAAARRLKAPAKHTIERIETILERPAPPGAGCDEAWAELEQEQKARAPR